MPGTVEAHVCGVLHLPQTQPFIHSSSSYELNIKQWWWLLCLVFIHMSVCIKWTTNSIVTRCSHCSLGKAITSRGHSSSLMTWKTKYIHLFWQETNPNLWPKQAADLELFPFSGCTCPSCHQHIPKSVRSIDVSMKTDRDFGGGGWFVRVQRAHRGHHPSASHQRKRLQKFELWTTSAHSGVYHLLVRFPRATARRRNRRGLIVRADRECQQLHSSTVQKVTGISRSLLTHHHQVEEILKLHHAIKIHSGCEAEHVSYR